MRKCLRIGDIFAAAQPLFQLNLLIKKQNVVYTTRAANYAANVRKRFNCGQLKKSLTALHDFKMPRV